MTAHYIFRFIRDCIENVVLPQPATDGSREESTRITARDVVHQCDLILRQLVTTYISAAKDGMYYMYVRCIRAELSSC